MQLIPYFNCNGNANELIEVYKKAFNATSTEIMLYGDNLSTKEAFPNHSDKILHAEIKIHDITIYVSDTTPDTLVTFGNNLYTNFNFDSIEQLEHAYNTLKEGGEVTQELADTFWNARYGQVTDKFGNPWSLNYSYPSED